MCTIGIELQDQDSNKNHLWILSTRHGICKRFGTSPTQRTAYNMTPRENLLPLHRIINIPLRLPLIIRFQPLLPIPSPPRRKIVHLPPTRDVPHHIIEVDPVEVLLAFLVRERPVVLSLGLAPSVVPLVSGSEPVPDHVELAHVSFGAERSGVEPPDDFVNGLIGRGAD